MFDKGRIQGLGLLGEMIRSQSSIRVPEIAAHPKSYGFPKGHPVMQSFLGVPIAAFGRPIGQIYLTEKQDAPEFSEQDQQMIELLAHSGTADSSSNMLVDQETGSIWDISRGLAKEGPLVGEGLQPVPSLSSYDWAFRDFSPNGEFYQP